MVKSSSKAKSSEILVVVFGALPISLNTSKAGIEAS